MILLMRTKDAGETLLAVKRDPRELSAVIVQKAGGQANTASGGDIGQRGIMICAVEVADLPGDDQAVLNGFQCLRRTAAHHQRPAVKVILADEFLPCQRIVFVCDQIDPALEQVVDLDARDLLCLFLQSKNDVRFSP